MQTFLPYSSAARSAACLDRQRLGKQRVEALQILRTLQGKSSGWANHPAVRMWRGYEPALALYGIAICDEWISRGHRDTCRTKPTTCRMCGQYEYDNRNRRSHRHLNTSRCPYVRRRQRI